MKLTAEEEKRLKTKAKTNRFYEDLYQKYKKGSRLTEKQYYYITKEKKKKEGNKVNGKEGITELEVITEEGIILKQKNREMKIVLLNEGKKLRIIIKEMRENND